MSDSDDKHQQLHDELSKEHEDPLIRVLHKTIRYSVRLLALLMVLVILWGVGDVVYVIYQHLSEPPLFLLRPSDFFDVFGAFMLVLIAIEIFINIRLYLGSDVIPIQLVVATALMAMARKVIVMDQEDWEPTYVLGIAAVVIALGVTYWLIAKKSEE